MPKKQAAPEKWIYRGITLIRIAESGIGVYLPRPAWLTEAASPLALQGVYASLALAEVYVDGLLHGLDCAAYMARRGIGELQPRGWKTTEAPRRKRVK